MSCLGCGAGAVPVLLDLGPQPPSNRFERAEESAAERHPLLVGQCKACGLLQIIRPMPPEMARSRFEWLAYNEPEGHLDDLVERLRRLPGLGTGSRIAGASYKDDTTLARFNRLGYANTCRADVAGDPGPADLLVARHILEHAHQPQAFLRALRRQVKPGGYLVFEMPDCTRFVDACDYSFLWEEHITYFSETTLRAFLSAAGAEVEAVHLYPYPLEDSLIAVVRNADAAPGAPAAGSKEAALAAGQRFAAGFARTGEQLRNALGSLRREGKRIAVFGAGHLAAKFINFFALSGIIECVVDDNPQKQALLMPGSRLPIRGSAVLAERAIDLCLLSLSPESEQKVLARNHTFLERGGEFRSIFAASPRSVLRVPA